MIKFMTNFECKVTNLLVILLIARLLFNLHYNLFYLTDFSE